MKEAVDHVLHHATTTEASTLNRIMYTPFLVQIADVGFLLRKLEAGWLEPPTRVGMEADSMQQEDQRA